MSTSSPSTPVCTDETGLGEHHQAMSLWVGPLTGLALAAAVAFVLLRSTVSSFVLTWYGSNTYSYGFVIAPISAFLVWRRRAQLKLVHPETSLTGLVLVLLFAGLWVAGNVADAQIIQQLAFIGLLDAMVVAFLGTAAFRVLRFPLLFLFFAVPTGESLVAPLQQFTASFTVNALRFSGIPAVQDGFVISTPTGDWRIAEACSGIRYLTSSTVVGALFAGAAFRSWKRRIALISISVLVPILANAVRAYLIVVLAYVSNNRIAAGVDHVMYGWLFFSLVTAILIGLAMRWREPEKQPLPAQGPIDSHAARLPLTRWAGCTALVVLMVVAASLTADSMWARAPAKVPIAKLWLAPPGWLATAVADHDWVPNFETIESETTETFTNGSREVSLYVASYPYKPRGVELINTSNAVGAYGEWEMLRTSYREVKIADRSVTVAEYLVSGSGERRLVWMWYLAGDELTASPYRVKLIQAESRLAGRPMQVSLFAVSARLTSQAPQAVDDLRAFVGGMSFPGLAGYHP